MNARMPLVRLRRGPTATPGSLLKLSPTASRFAEEAPALCRCETVELPE